MSFKTFITVLILQIWIFSQITDASNWAQVSGDNRQNLAVSAESPWTRRWGFATASIEVFDQFGLPDEQNSKIFILGGDSYKKDTTGKDSFHYNEDGSRRDPNADVNSVEWPEPGGGNVMNDVWITTGANWSIILNERERTRVNGPMPTRVSLTTWTKVPDWPGLPWTAADWRDYLACCHPSNPFPCSDYSEEGISVCAAGVDVFRRSRRFSPRRGHIAVTLYPKQNISAYDGIPYDPGLVSQPTIVVIGGRARSLERMIGSEISGGLLDNPLSPMTERHKAILLSDVWITTDGEHWDFTNQGCWVNEEDHIRSPGTVSARCNTDSDCYKARLGDAYCSPQKTCVCRSFSPRERFGATVAGQNIYIAGGVRYRQPYLCGHYSCGNEFATLLNDVWVSSTLGRTWTRLNGNAAFSPRSDHSLLYSGGYLMIIGGRQTVAAADPRPHIASDMYLSVDGTHWYEASLPDMFQNGTDGFNVSAYTDEELSERSTSIVFDVPGRMFHSAIDVDGHVYLVFGSEEFIVPLTEEELRPPLTAAEKVALAAANAPSNVLRERQRPPVVVLPGELSVSTRLVPSSDVFSLYTTNFSAFVDLPGYGKGWLPVPLETFHEITHKTGPYNQSLWVKNPPEPTEAGKRPFSIEELERLNAQNLPAWGNEGSRGTFAFYPDFSPEAYQFQYIWPGAPLLVLNYSVPVLHFFSSIGIETLDDLAELSDEQLAFLLDPAPSEEEGDAEPAPFELTAPITDIFPRFCHEYQRVRRLLENCKLRVWGYEGQEWSRTDVFDFAEDADDSEESEDAEPAPCGTSDDFSFQTEELDFVCRWAPPAKRSFGLTKLHGRVFLMGGWEDEDYYGNDMWYRDSRRPRGMFSRLPRDHTSESLFEFFADEPGVIFQYRVEDVQSAAVVREWTEIQSPLDAKGINKNRKPTRVTLRAVDAAGNRDTFLRYSENQWVWTYIPPFPLLLVILLLLLFLFCCCLGYYLYHRHKRRKALERYLARRLAKKLRRQANEEDVRRKRKGREARRNSEEARLAARAAALRDKFRTLLRTRADRTVEEQTLSVGLMNAGAASSSADYSVLNSTLNQELMKEETTALMKSGDRRKRLLTKKNRQTAAALDMAIKKDQKPETLDILEQNRKDLVLLPAVDLSAYQPRHNADKYKVYMKQRGGAHKLDIGTASADDRLLGTSSSDVLPGAVQV